MKIAKPLKLLLLTPVALACVLTAFATQAADTNLYKIEVVVFERLTPEDNSPGRERWPRDIQLNLPGDAVTLEAAEQYESGVPSGYQHLPEQEYRLTREKNALSRNGQARVLFHQAWVQALDQAGNRPVRITGGGTFGLHTELDGTIRMSLGRFVQLDADLWLSKFVNNSGQVPEMWSPLPVSEEAAGSEELVHQEEFAGGQPALDAHQPAPYDEAGAAMGPFERAEVADQGVAAPFLVEQIVTLNQKRRLRLGELHYLDHPKLGILVLVQRHEGGP